MHFFVFLADKMAKYWYFWTNFFLKSIVTSSPSRICFWICDTLANSDAIREKHVFSVFFKYLYLKKYDTYRAQKYCADSPEYYLKDGVVYSERFVRVIALSSLENSDTFREKVKISQNS